MSATKKRKFDARDTGALRDLQKMHGWHLLVERLQQEERRETESLLGDLDQVATAKLRGRIAALRMVRTLPAIILKEAGTPAEE